MIPFTDLFDASPNPYVVLDPSFRILSMNAAYLAVTGRARDELVGRAMFEAFPTPDTDVGRESRALLEESLRRAVETGERDSLALIRYDLPTAAGPDGKPRYEARYWSATHSPLKDDQGRVIGVLQHTVDVTDIHQMRQAAARARTVEEARTVDLLRRAEAVQETNRELNRERRFLRDLFRQAPGFMAVVNGPDHVFELANEAYLRLIGRDDVVGKPVRVVLPEVVGQGFVDLLDQVYVTGEAYTGEGVRLTVNAPGAAPQERYVDFLYHPLRDDTGRPTGVFVQGHDVTERMLADRRQRLLLDELNHRVKNTLATVQSIAGQTARGHREPGSFRQVFESRILALSKTHDLLTASHWEGADFAEIARQELAPYGRRARAVGPSVRLRPRAALTLGLVLHELATNAAKYGSLSIDTGRVDLDWRVERDDLHVLWRESRGPAVVAPEREGFGSRLIRRSIQMELGGSAEAEWRPDGLEVRLTVPVE